LKEWLKNNLKGDPYIWTIVVFLGIISVAVVYSSVSNLAFRFTHYNTEVYLQKHIMLVLAGLGFMYIGHRIHYKLVGQVSRLLVIVSYPLVAYAQFFGSSVNNASRWIAVPIIHQQFQPSDLAKVAVVAFVAFVLSKAQNKISDEKESINVIKKIAWVVPLIGLIAMSNYSTAALLFASILLLLFVGRVSLKHIGYICLGVVLFGSLAFFVGDRGPTFLRRISTFFEAKEPEGQLEQSFIAIVNGGLVGRGPGGSLQRDFLSQSSSDFIFAIIIEEYGWIGGLLVVFLYLALLFRGMQAVAKSKDSFGGLLSAGISFSLVLQAMFNMMVAVGLVPVTGQPLPFLSMGGTSLIFTGFSLGILVSISRSDFERESAIGSKEIKQKVNLNVGKAT
jgi:cell division protein FtsW